MAPAPLCAGCQQKLPIRKNLTCTLCKSIYDLKCAGILKDYYMKSMTLELRKSWKCQTCICKMLKTGNIDTPVRTQKGPDYNPVLITPTEGHNITIRNKITTPNDDTTSSEDLSLLGDTLQAVDVDNVNNTLGNINLMNNVQSQLNMQTLSELIILRLRENNKSIIEELQIMIQTEINRAITELRQDLEYKTKTLTEQNDRRKQEIDSIHTKLEEVRIENENLKKEIRTLTTTATQKNQTPSIPEHNYKKLVLYGFADYYNEPEWELHNRLIELFREIADVDLSGYIEDMYRVGRKGTKNRPLVMELLSKRMTRYIISNSHSFQGSGLGISEFLDAKTRKERAQIKDELFKARKNGHYAIIRNNQLYINGKLIKKDDCNNDQRQYINTTYQKNDTTVTYNTEQPYQINRPSQNETVNYTFRN